MTYNKRVYSKANPEIPIEDLPNTSPTYNAEPKVDFSHISLGYKKEEPTEEPRYFIVIISGGEVREKNYFKIISNPDRFRSIKVVFKADPNQLNPMRMLEFAKQLQERFQSSESDTPDEFFLISDVDHFIGELIEIQPECKRLGLQLIVSNPCFEVWLYYSKKGDKLVKYPIPLEREKISNKLKTWISEGSGIIGGIDPVKAIFDIEQNIENAKSNYVVDHNTIPDLFSTSMYLLAEKILPAIEEDLAKLKYENELRAKHHIKNTI
ncbi:MAG: RloB family protein [Bacteroidales bacterium]